MDKILGFNADRCTGCGLCELICSLVHVKACNPERSRIRILRMEEKGIHLPTFCQECEEPACLAACPVSAITRNPSSGMVAVNDEACVQCKECIAACPYQGIFFDPVDEKITKCDLCAGDPKCVKFCETKAIEFIERNPATVQKKENYLQKAKKILKTAEECFG